MPSRNLTWLLSQGTAFEALHLLYACDPLPSALTTPQYEHEMLRGHALHSALHGAPHRRASTACMLGAGMHGHASAGTSRSHQ